MSSSEESEFLGEKQTNVLRVLRTFSSLMSVLGSSLIISHVVIRKRRGMSWNPKSRLLAGLSVSDLIFSAETFIFTPFVYPITSPSPVCSFDVFIHILGNAAPYYLGALSFYFVSVIRYNVKDEQFAARYEPFCHVIPISAALIPAVTGLFLAIYNPKASGLGCWVEDYPRGCSDSDNNNSDTQVECRGDGIAIKLFPTIATVLPFLLAFLTMIVSNILIYRFVRRLERRNARYSITASVTTSLATRPDSSPSTRRSSFAVFARRSITTSTNTEQQPLPGRASISTSAPSSSESMQRSKKIASQSFCYVGVFLLSYLPGFCFWIAGFIYPDGQTNGAFFFLQVINAIFFPAQGFFNMVIYLRPQYLMWREAAAGNSVLYSWRMAASLQPPLPPKIRQRRRVPPALQDSNNDTTANNSNNSNTEGEKAKLEGLDHALSGAFLSDAFTCTDANTNVSQVLFSDNELTQEVEDDANHTRQRSLGPPAVQVTTANITGEEEAQVFHSNHEDDHSLSDTSIDIFSGTTLDKVHNAEVGDSAK